MPKRLSVLNLFTVTEETAETRIVSYRPDPGTDGHCVLGTAGIVSIIVVSHGSVVTLKQVTINLETVTELTKI